MKKKTESNRTKTLNTKPKSKQRFDAAWMLGNSSYNPLTERSLTTSTGGIKKYPQPNPSSEEVDAILGTAEKVTVSY